MRKIGILTYFWSDNNGTFLQAYSTMKACQRWFPQHRVELINLRQRHIFWHPAKRDVNPHYLLTDWGRSRIFKRCRREHLALSPGGFITTDYDKAAAYVAAQNYDLVVVGADVILQMLDGYLKRGQPPIYWLPPTLKCRKVVCAGSAGTMTYESLSEPMRKRLAESIQAYDLVGVRDDVTHTLMEALGLRGDPRLQRVPDPTFTFDIDPAPAEEAVKRFGIDLSRPTIGTSLPMGRADCAAVINHYRSQGFRTVSLESPVPADYWLWNMSPFEWAGVHRFFRFSITDRFHGTVFNLKNGTPLFAMDRATQFTRTGESKKYSLLKQFGLEKTNHINIEQTTDLQEIIQKCDAAVAAFDRQKVLDKAALLRREYEAFLDKVAALL